MEKDSTDNELKKVSNSKLKRMKLIMTVLLVLVMIIFIGYRLLVDEHGISRFARTERILRIEFPYRTFEETLSEFPTDVVVAQYVGSRSFGRNLTEFEFTVSDRILGDAADRIFIYEENGVVAHVTGAPSRVEYYPSERTFEQGVNYLLPLDRISTVYANTHEDGFRFLSIVIDLDNPGNSMMYSEPLYRHTEILDFTGNITREEILSLVEELTRDNPPAPDFIRSEVMEDIIEGSPHILLVEINEPELLSHERSSRDWMDIDIYHVTVIESLKGGIDVGAELVVVFFANTVFPGEQHIVAVEQIPNGSFYDFTSRNSLFSMDDLDEILTIIENE